MNVKDNSRPVIAINKTCTLTSRELQTSRLEILTSRLWWSQRLGLGRWASRSRAFTYRAHPWHLQCNCRCQTTAMATYT